jgi:NAD(P)-dependent dehydrogenase (short-subunit alcohol dehydrogenase family)
MTSTTAAPVILITGASKGIGEALAYAYAKEGAQLALAARDTALLQTVADRCRSLGGKALVIACDVGVNAACQAAIEACIREYGRLDTLVNNAGATMWAKFADIRDMDILERIMRVNYLGAVYMTHHALPHLIKSQGRLVGIASLAGLTGVPTRSGYCASKHAMRGFFDALRIELMDSGVTVTMIYPGFVSTGIRENASGPDGKPIAISPVKEGEVMSVDTCVALTHAAIRKRDRECVMTARGRLGMWLKLIAPGWVDRLAMKAIATGR